MVAPRLVIKNSHGTTQIDEKWKNYGFRQIIPVHFDIAEPTYYTLSVTGLAVLVAHRVTTLHVLPLSSYISGSTWYFNYRVDPPFITGGGSETVYFYIYDVPSGPYSNFGLKIVHQGDVVFHSDMLPMKVPSGGVQSCNVDFTGTSGRIYAPLVLLNPIRGEFNGSSYSQSTRSLRVSGASILSTDRFVGFGSFLEVANEGLYAAVDVTGLS